MLGTRPRSSTDGDGSGWAPSQMVSALPLHRTNIMTGFFYSYRLRTSNPPSSDLAPSGTQECSDESPSSLSSVLNSSRKTSLDGLFPSGSGDSNCDDLLSNLHDMRPPHPNNRCIAQNSGVYPENPSPKAAKWRMDGIAKVTHPISLPPHFHHTPASGACT